ncbi:hypothetical protein PRIPAC_70132, partial [Pristionchus pacificus]|uniref:Uncharacterized protein n=1 Tax=Pristionchus pacificus TaxID=54126 RepID=A0A2A6CZZ3_PRIPA
GLSSNLSGFLQHMWRSHNKWTLAKAGMTATCIQCKKANPTCGNPIQNHQEECRSVYSNDNSHESHIIYVSKLEEKVDK